MSNNHLFQSKLIIKNRIANLIGNKLKEIKGGYLGRERFLLLTLIYKLLPYLRFNYSRLIEWNFVLRNLPKIKLRVLDVGSTSSLFIYELAGRGYDTYAIDTRPYQERLPPSIKFFRYDIVATPFFDSFFDVIIAISVIEHIGLGFYGDPKYDNGDFEAMKEIRRILKNNGLVFITTLVGNHYIITPDGNERIYDKTRLSYLIKPFKLIKGQYYIFQKGKWREVNKERAFKQPPSRFALACIILQNEK